MHLTYPSRLAEDEIVGRLMGPDHCGGYLQAVAAEHLADGGTRVRFRPVPPGDTQMTRDAFGQWWLPLPAPSADSGIGPESDSPASDPSGGPVTAGSGDSLAGGGNALDGDSETDPAVSA